MFEDIKGLSKTIERSLPFFIMVLALGFIFFMENPLLTVASVAVAIGIFFIKRKYLRGSSNV